MSSFRQRAAAAGFGGVERGSRGARRNRTRRAQKERDLERIAAAAWRDRLLEALRPPPGSAAASAQTMLEQGFSDGRRSAGAAEEDSDAREAAGHALMAVATASSTNQEGEEAPDSEQEEEEQADAGLWHIKQAVCDDKISTVALASAAPVARGSVGARMLLSMGWTPGTGLGQDGSGRSEPLTTHLKSNRFGIGLDVALFGKATHIRFE